MDWYPQFLVTPVPKLDWFEQIIAKASSADLVLLACIGLIAWLVTTKKKIARGTVELAIKYVFWIACGTLAFRALQLLAQTYLLRG